jgi:hypothetical protein
VLIKLERKDVSSTVYFSSLSAAALAGFVDDLRSTQSFKNTDQILTSALPRPLLDTVDSEPKILSHSGSTPSQK